MAVRPLKNIPAGAIIMTMTVAAGQTVTEGYGVKFASADNEVQNAGAGERALMTALESGTAGNRVQVLVHAVAIVPVKVGTGGATRGLPATMAADGFIDRALGGGTTAREISGFFMQTGVVGDKVGLAVAPFVSVSS